MRIVLAIVGFVVLLTSPLLAQVGGVPDDPDKPAPAAKLEAVTAAELVTASREAWVSARALVVEYQKAMQKTEEYRTYAAALERLQRYETEAAARIKKKTGKRINWATGELLP